MTAPRTSSVLALLLGAAGLAVACAGQDATPAGPGPGDDGGVADGAPPDAESPYTGPACEVKKTGTAGLLLEGTVLAPDEVLRGGKVVIDGDGIIRCVGAACSAPPEATHIACARGVISPGLINPHDHITYANDGPIPHGTERYEHRHDWRRGIRGHQAIDTKRARATTEVVRAAELRFLMSGATSTAAAGGAPGLLRNLDTNVAEMEGLPLKVAVTDTFPLKDSTPAFRTTDCNYAATRRTAESIATYDAYLPHIAEGIDAESRNEIVCQSTGTYDLLQRQTAVIHSIAAKPADAAIYRADMTAVVWSPRSNVDLYGDTAQVTMLDAQGVQIALGTDWLPSGSMNLARELRCADELNTKYYGKHFSDEALWRMVTVNAAFAVGGQRHIGMLKVGYHADVTLFDARVNHDHRAVVAAGAEDVLLVLRGGKPLYGDDALVAGAGGADCETLDVCTVAKRACVAKDTGTPLAAIRAAGEAVYPLFFCKDAMPTAEPSCTPWRASYKEGITAADKDGDGVPDAEDNCPTVFNPKRPLDGATQGDADGDGKGDACDPCPDAPGESCPRLDANDLDGDGVKNGADNCPENANPDQADADSDGYGDACPKGAPPPPPPPPTPPVTLTVPALRDPASPTRPSSGARVRVDDVVVTFVKTAGTNKALVVQDPTATSWAGLYVFVGAAAPVVQAGDRVSVTGTFGTFAGVEQLDTRTGGSVAASGTGTVPTPIVVTLDEINAPDVSAAPTSRSMQLQSMLVRVNAVGAVTTTVGQDFTIAPLGQTAPVATVSSFYAADSGPSPFPVTALPASFASITGIVNAFGFGSAPAKARLAPRSAADVVAQ